MSRARDRTELYLPLNVLETDADRVQHGPPRDGEHALARTIAAYLRTLTGGPDTLVAAELGLEPDPIAHTPGLLPEPLLDELARLQQLTLIQQQQRLNDRTAAAQAERARAGFDGRGDAGGQHGGVEHWTRRPLGHHTDEHLAHLAGQAAVRRQRELLDVQRHLVDAHASLISARVGTGPAVQALRGRLRELQAAAEAGVRARELEAAQRAAYTANRTDLERLQDLSRLQDRNALFLLIANRTTRTQIRARIRDLRGDVDERTRYAEQLQKPAAAARQQARHPDTTGGYDARHQRNDQQVITDLRRLREGWDTLHAAALAGDVADADNQLAGAELRHTAATAPGPRTRAVADELATRRALPGRHAAAETAQRAAHHAAQAEQAQKQARQEAERLRAQRGPHPHRPPIEPDHGPGHSWGR
jgi:hypothetical protein